MAETNNAAPMEFSEVYLVELLAVEARRRRHRIEHLVGALPNCPSTRPPVDAPSDPAPGLSREEREGRESLFGELTRHLERTRDARDRLDRARQAAREAPVGEPRPEPTEAPATGGPTPMHPGPPAEAAEEALKAAKAWHESATLYRDLAFRELLAFGERLRAGPRPNDVAEAWARWDQAEAILAVAARAVSAAAQARLSEQSTAHSEAASVEALRTVAPWPEDPEWQDRLLEQLRENLSEPYGRLLAYEEKAEEALHALAQAGVGERRARADADRFRRDEDSQPAQAARAAQRAARHLVHEAEKVLCGWALQAARAVHDLLHRAEECLRAQSVTLPVGDRAERCAWAEAAALLEVQQASQAWNHARLELECGRPEMESTRLPPPPGSQPPEEGRANPEYVGGPPPPRPTEARSPAAAECGGPPDALLIKGRKQALDRDLVGLALSGGGIRSATFALGLLQGLAQLRLLGMVDYLSTVSGGGYIGSWLAAWVRREGSLLNVERQLSPNRVSQAQARRTTDLPRGQPVDAEPEPVHHLRAYSRYLSPRFGVFSPDTWSLFTIYLRNLFVNALFLVPLALALVTGWKLLVHGYNAPLGPDMALRGGTAVSGSAALVGDVVSADGETGWGWPRLLLTAALLGIYAAGTACFFLAEERLSEPRRGPHARKAEGASHWAVLIPFFLMAAGAPWALSLDPAPSNVGGTYAEAHQLRYFGQGALDSLLKEWPNALRFACCFGLSVLALSVTVRTARWAYLRWRGDATAWNWRGVGGDMVAAAAFGGALWLVLDTVIWPLSYAAAHGAWPGGLFLLHTVGMPLVCATMVLGGFVEMAVLGRWLSEYEREWRSRLAAYLLMGAASWLVFGAAVLYVPWLYECLLNGLRAGGAEATARTLKGALPALWAAISGGGAWLVSRGAPAGQTAPRPWWLRPVMVLAPAVFLVGLFAGVSAMGQGLVEELTPWKGPPPPAAAAGWVLQRPVPVGGIALAVDASTLPAVPFPFRTLRHPVANGVLICVAALLAVLLANLVNVNRFSLHSLYANRLTRCYLGASRRKRAGPSGAGSLGAATGVPASDPVRRSNPFTGFDPLDDLPLADLRTVGGPAVYSGPLPLINCALNCLAGDELAYQDRRADAFAMTPQACGGRLTGSAPTPPDPPGSENLTLGRALTISGAAVDPNMSGLTAPLTALMAVFNTRLGWWLENPHPGRRSWPRRAKPWAAAEPGFLWPLLSEFLGRTNEQSYFVHLSDGGHFENLGVYELVRRRCRFIVVVDAGTDPRAASDNMATMLRLVRTDFGVRIELDVSRLQAASAGGLSPWHGVVGKIRYDEVDDAAVPGVLVYMQATLSGDEPPDVLQYSAHHPSFPRQSTLNQFFDEAQFECYRALGHHTALEVFGEASAAWDGGAQSPAQHLSRTQAVFTHLRRQWFPEPPCSEPAWLGAAQASLELERFLSASPGATELSESVYPELRRDGGAPADGDLSLCRAVGQMLQVMEIAWAAMDMDDYYTHPLNRGWVNTFRRWTSTPEFQRYWPFLKAEYSAPFVEFCEGILNLLPVRVRADHLKLVPPAAEQVKPVPPALEHALGKELQRADERDLENLDEEFAQEWAGALTRPGGGAAFSARGLLADMVARSLRERQAAFDPLVWLLRAPQGASPGGRGYCCGIACAARTRRQRLLEPQDRDINEEAEFLFWLRGPYRTLGYGTQVLPRVLRRIEAECAFQNPGGTPLRRLAVYYPVRAHSPGARLELDRFMAFFFDHGFRRIRQPDTGLGSQFVILKRALRG